MYKKAIGVLIIIQILFLIGYIGILFTNKNTTERIKTVYEIRLNKMVLADRKNSVMEICQRTSSEQRVVTYQVLEPSCKSEKQLLSQQDYENLLRIVEAEASGEDEEGKLLVANVVMNRVKDDSFPDTVTEVVFQKNGKVTQFSPVANGRFWKVSISEETIRAVDRALNGEDISQGALYFAARKYASPQNMKWFDECLEYLFTHGGHEFYAE